MLKTLREKLISGLLSCACLFAGAGFGVAVEGANAETSGVKNDNPSVTDVTAPFAQGSLGDSSTALRMTESGEGMSGEAYSLEILSKNVSYSESMYLMYAVSWSGFTRQVDQVKMLFWDEPQAEYTYDNASFVQDEYSITYLKNEECLVFYSEGISAKEMVDISYCAAYAVVNGVEVYSDIEKYSVVDYVYDMRQKANLTEKQKNMFTDMLNYGASAQILLDYRADVLANKNRYEITVVNGVLPDGFSVGRYQEGERIVLTAEETFGGATFSHWEDESGAVVGGTLSSKITISGNKTYKAVYRDDLTYELSAKGDYYTVTGYRGKGGALVIPSEFMGIPVRYVAEKAFQDNAKIASVTIGEGLLTLGAYAFSGCSNLTSISLPSTVKSVGDYALYACANLANISVAEGNAVYESIGGHLYFKGADYMLQYAIGSTATEFVVPESLKSIAGSAFRGAVNLTKVVIGDQVTVIGSNAFKGCTNLTIYCEASEQPSGWNSGWNGGSPVVWGYNQEPEQPEEPEYSVGLAYALNDDGAGYTVTGLGDCTDTDLVIPSTHNGLPVTRVGEDAFWGCSSLTSVVIPDSVTSIGEYAFTDNYDIMSIVIPKNIAYIGTDAFRACIRLVEVVNKSPHITVEKGALGNGQLGYNALVVYNSEDEFEGTHLTSDNGYIVCNVDSQKVLVDYEGTETDLVLPSYITDIAYCAFWSYENITSVIIPDGVQNIGVGAFQNCSALESVSIPNSVTSIGGYAFYGCSSLTSVVIPDGVTSIGDFAFYFDENLTSVGMPDTLTSIGTYAFAFCTDLMSVEIPDTLTSIGRMAFYECISLTAVYITNLEAWCNIDFYTNDLYTNPLYYAKKLYLNNELLTEVVIPESVTEIKDGVFVCCESLTSVVLHDKITSIGVGAFYCCTGLTSFNVPNSVTIIKGGAFNGCTNLVRITIGNGVTFIGNSAFHHCNSLTELVIPNNVTTIEGGLFTELGNLTIYCEAESQPDGWDSGWNWVGNLENYVPVVWGYKPATPVSAFEWTSDGESVTITKYVGDYTDVVIPATIDGLPVTAIGEFSFQWDNRLTSVVIPDSVTKIGDEAFRDCNNISSVSIPDSVTNIGYLAFYNCSNLTIYCETESQPSGWNSYWNFSNCPVVWGYGQEPDMPEEPEIPEGSVGLAYSLNDDGASYTVTGMGDCTDTDLVIPATYNGLPVTSIGYEAFVWCSSLTSVVIPDSVMSIGVRAFAQCRNLTSVVIPDGVTVIENNTFGGCEGLESVKLSTNLVKVEWQAFYNCKKLKAIEIPNSLTTIGKHGFYGCESLTRMEIPENVVEIGDVAFTKCKALEYFEVAENNSAYTAIDGNLYTKDGKTLRQYAVAKTEKEFLVLDTVVNIADGAFAFSKNLTKVVISAGLENIGGWAFQECDSLIRVCVPNGVTSIGTYAFLNCDALTEVLIPESVTSIGEYAFYCCDNLTIYCEASEQPSGWDADWNPDNRPVVWGYGQEPEYSVGLAYALNDDGAGYTVTGLGECTDTDLVIPSTHNGLPVTTISGGAFMDCSSLTSVVIPNSVTNIIWWAFYNCSSLTSIAVDENNPVYKDIDGNLYTKDEKTLVRYAMGKAATEFIIPDGVTAVSDFAFGCCINLTSLVIPNSVTSIGERAFERASGLSAVYITDLEAWCNINFSTNDLYTNPLYYAKKLYLNNELLTEVVIPESVTEIKDGVFVCCESLTSVVLHDEITSIGVGAFYCCTGLTSFNVPNSVTAIKGGAFNGCENLASITIGNSVTFIGNSTFTDCNSLPRLFIPSSVIEIESGLAPSCENTKIYCEAESKPSGWEEGWNSACPVVWGYKPTPTSAFEYTSDGSTVTITDYVGEYTDVVVPFVIDGLPVISIGVQAFAFCGNLRSVVIGDGVTSIGEMAFMDCGSLTTVVIPNGMTTIGKWAFSYCGYLARVVIPDTVMSIGYEAFYCCHSLTIYCEAESQPSGWSSSWNYSNCPVVWGYKEPTPASAFSYTSDGASMTITGYNGDYSEVVIPFAIDGLPVTAIGNHAFYQKSNVESVIIPSSVTTIGESVFSGCTRLEEIIIPDSVTVVGSHAFYMCTGLTSATIGNGVATIEPAAFRYCENLTNLVLGNNVATIGESAFEGCSALQSVVIPSSVTSVGNRAFYDCAEANIYCVAESKPSGWAEYWNYSGGTAYWYSEGEPMLNTDGSGYEGNYWRYVNGDVVAWVWDSSMGYEMSKPINDPSSTKTLVKMKLSASSTVVVDAIATDYGADPTGRSDSTQAIQAAVDSVANLGGGTVFLPKGKYLVTSTVTVPNYVSIVGDWNMPVANNTDRAFDYGTVILAKPQTLGGAAPHTKPLFDLGDSVGMIGLTFFYPEQNAGNVVDYGYTIYANAPVTATFRNLTFLNSVYGIGVSLKTYANELVNLENIYGTFLKTAIRQNCTTDVGFYDNINISTKYWKNASSAFACENGSALDAFVAENLTAIVLGDLDDQLISNVNIDGGYIGMKFTSGIRSGAGFWGAVHKANISCNIGVYAEHLNPVCGVVFTDSTVGIVENNAEAGVVKMSNSVYEAKGSGKVVQEAGSVASASVVTPLALATPSSERLFVANGLVAGGAVDNSSALQAVLDSVGDEGGIVLIPNGTYRLDKTVFVPKNVELRSSLAVFSRSGSAQESNNGVFFISYVTASGGENSGATFVLAENAGVVGVRIWHALNDFEKAKSALAQGNYPEDVSIRGNGSGAYAYNNESVGAYVGYDFTACDNHILKSNYGVSYAYFIKAGGANGVITQCLTNPNFMSRTNIYNLFDASLANVANWQKITVNGEENEFFPILREEICRTYTKMVYLEDATNEVAFNVFAYGHGGLFEMVNVSATLVNTSLDNIPYDQFVYELSGGSCEIASSLRVYGTSVRVNSGRMTAYGRIAFGEAKEQAYDSDVSIEDKIPYVSENAKRLSLFNCDSSNSAFNVTLNTVSTYVKEGSGSWKWKTNTLEGKFTAIDISAYKNGYLHFYLYCSDVTKLGKEGQVEITSSGKCDINEYSWNILQHITQNGWNEVWLDLSVVGVTGGAADLTAINYLRIYLLNATATFYIDGIELVTD